MDAQFLDLPVIQDFLTPLLTGLSSPIFTQRLGLFNSLLLSLAAAQPVFMRHRSHQIDQHFINSGYHSAGDWPACEKSLSDSACHED